MATEMRKVSGELLVGFAILVGTGWWPAGERVPHAAFASEGGHDEIPNLPLEALESLPPDGGERYNRLIFEKSPYLLQHADNPVDWYPWGEAAFRKAREIDKPIFLSVGYSTCHWCHVMERESFEDETVAGLMNKLFIPVKVDREERPDVDKIYMDITQAMTGGGGWPMTVVMTPDGKPFFAGTYFPKESRGGRPGMLDLLPQLGEAWENDRTQIMAVAERAEQAMVQINAGAPGEALGKEALEKAYQGLARRFDSRYGGFGSAPKFPVPHNLTFLLRYWQRTGEAQALEMVEKTLTAMRLGGIYDHVGFGFHRYSTDPVWLLPHFEKMLYDQALLAMAYIEVYVATGKPFYADVAREVFTYVLSRMTSRAGGFFSAENADSEGEEGKFYLWTPEEVRAVLGEEDGALFNRVYNIVEGGNFREESTGKRPGSSIPHLRGSLSEIAQALEMSEAELKTRLEAARLNLFAVRENRVHPLKDDKILTDWNGLMIAALAKGAQHLDVPHYADAARRAADFVLAKLRRPNGRLLKRYRQGEAGLPAHLDDYAFLVWGLIELYEATFETDYLSTAVELTDTMLEHFWDDEEGGLYLTADDQHKLLVRGKEVYDGALPSGNSVAALNLIRLSRMTARTAYETKAHATARAFSGTVGNAPSAFTMLMQAVDFAVGPSFEVVVAGDPAEEKTAAMLDALRERYLPRKVVLLRPEAAQPAAALARLAPYTQPMRPLEQTATAYVCQNFTCDLPTTDIGTMLESLGLTD